jgi:hypothetical protein
MPRRVTSILNELERRKADYGDEIGRRKLELLRLLHRRRLPKSGDVLRLHEVLCFLRAYPDDAELLAQVEQMLARFGDRGDVRQHRDRLADSGVAGTAIQFEFYATTATWLARRWGANLSIDWDEFAKQDRLEPLLSQLTLPGEWPGLDEFPFDVREWIGRLKGPDETDAAFLLRRLEHVRMDARAREELLDDLDIPYVLSPGRDTPARSREKWPVTEVAYQKTPLQRSRVPVSDEVRVPPHAVRPVSPRQGKKLIDVARAAMAVRRRDLDAFADGDENDVRMVECGNGLQFAYIGVRPERRFLLETLYGFLVLKNGVIVGYGTYVGLFGSAEVAYTVFDTFRSAEASMMYVRALANAAHLFGFDTFMVDPYQLGQDNEDAIQSGAWWFYHKMGFRPRDPALRRIMRREQQRMKTNRAYRSSAATLRKLAEGNVYLHLKGARDDVMGVLPLAGIGLHVTRYLSERFGYDRRKAAQVCSNEAAKLLGVRSFGSFSPGERLAWTRWAPLVLILPGIQRWSRENRRSLAQVVRAKGGRRESDYLRLFDRHRLLRRALQRLAETE